MVDYAHNDRSNHEFTTLMKNSNFANAKHKIEKNIYVCMLCLHILGEKIAKCSDNL